MYFDQIETYGLFGNETELYEPFGKKTKIPKIDKWFDFVIRFVAMPFYEMITEMMDLNPLSRLTIEQVIARYQQILPSIKKLFEGKLVRQFFQPYARMLPWGYQLPRSGQSARRASRRARSGSSAAKTARGITRSTKTKTKAKSLSH